MLGLQLVGEPDPLAPEDLAAHAGLPAEYVALMTAWGPGVAVAEIELPDPREPDGLFAILQARYRLHAPHQRAMGRWANLGTCYGRSTSCVSTAPKVSRDAPPGT
jgi:hypothetical protein